MAIKTHLLSSSKTVLVAVAGAALGYFAVPLDGEGNGISVAQAQEQSAAEQRANLETRKIEPLREATFKQISEAVELFEAKQVSQAIAVLNRMLTSGTLNGHETAMVHTNLAGFYADQGNYNAAITALEKAIATKQLPAGMELTHRYNLGQLYMATGNFRKAISFIEEWMRLTPDPPAQAHYLLGLAYYQTNRKGEALTQIRTAVDKSPTPVENHYALLYQLYFEKRDFKSGVSTLEKMVVFFPGNRNYWASLTAGYNALNQDKKFFAATEMMYRQGMLKTSAEFETLAQLYLNNETPYKAARLLDKEIKAGNIKKTKDNYELLANAWFASREWKRAVGPLRTAAGQAGDGKLYLRLGRTLLRDDEFDKAEEALRRALNRGGLGNEQGTAWLLLGQVRYNLDQTDQALEAFVSATDYEDSQKNAIQWIKILDTDERYKTLVLDIETRIKLKEIEERRRKNGELPPEEEEAPAEEAEGEDAG